MAICSCKTFILIVNVQFAIALEVNYFTGLVGQIFKFVKKNNR